jgi:hypothetical protein
MAYIVIFVKLMKNITERGRFLGGGIIMKDWVNCAGFGAIRIKDGGCHETHAAAEVRAELWPKVGG